jgi:hypothetical protein
MLGLEVGSRQHVLTVYSNSLSVMTVCTVCSQRKANNVLWHGTLYQKNTIHRRTLLYISAYIGLYILNRTVRLTEQTTYFSRAGAAGE